MFIVLLFVVAVSIHSAHSEEVVENGIIWHEKVRPKKIIDEEEKEPSSGNTLAEEYIINTSQRKFHILLEPHTDTYFPDVSINRSNHVIRLRDIVKRDCHFSGTFKEGGGRVMMDTCNGLRGILIDRRNHIYFIEPLGKEGWHNLTRHVIEGNRRAEKKTKKGWLQWLRERRSATKLRDAPWNYIGNMGTIKENRMEKDWKYIQTAFVVDNAFYKWMDSDVQKVFNYINSITNYANMLYAQGGFKIAVTMLDIWVDEDQIDMEGEFQREFEDYNEFVLLGEKGWTHDYAQFLTRTSFGLAGSSIISTLCRGASASTVYAWSANPYKLAGTSAHELGHSIGLGHYDEKTCHCPSTVPCVMTPVNSQKPVTNFAICSLEEMKRICGEGYCNCLKDPPAKVFNSPKCGNGFVEDDEECDCGDPVTCKNQCCNAATCKLRENAECAHGKCCSEKCRFRPAGSVCRPKTNECDLQEVCAGDNEECPKNIGAEDFKVCNNGKGYCYNSTCSLTLEGQCKVLWGPNGHYGYELCYENGNPVNIRGDKWGNCGNKNEEEFHSCTKRNAICGRVLCYGDDLPRFVRVGHGRQTKIFTDTPNRCRAGLTHVSGIIDPTMARDGTKCGENKICMNKACVKISDQTSLHACHGLCKNGGTCTGKGFCLCPADFSGRTCEKVDERQKSPKFSLPSCHGKCHTGVCNVATQECWCPPGTQCPDCGRMDSGNIEGVTCRNNVTRAIGREVMDCGSSFDGVFVKRGCKAKLGNSDEGPLKEMMHNYRDEIVWEDMKKSATRITCLCAKEAKKRGYKTFGVQFWGECWGSYLAHDEFQSKESVECNNCYFKPCTSRDNLCIGKETSTALYSFT